MGRRVRWIKHKIRDIPFNGSYIDNFSDVDGDVDVVSAGRTGLFLSESLLKGK